MKPDYLNEGRTAPAWVYQEVEAQADEVARDGFAVIREIYGKWFLAESGGSVEETEMALSEAIGNGGNAHIVAPNTATQLVGQDVQQPHYLIAYTYADLGSRKYYI